MDTGREILPEAVVTGGVAATEAQERACGTDGNREGAVGGAEANDEGDGEGSEARGEGGRETSGKNRAGFNLSTVTVTGFPRFRITNVLVSRRSTGKGPS